MNHERSRPILQRVLAVRIFVEHICKLSIKFICLFQFRFSNAITISPIKGWDTLSVFRLTIYVLGLALMSQPYYWHTNRAAFWHRPLYPFSKFQILTSFYYCQSFSLLHVFYFSTNLPIYLRGYPRDRGYRSTGFRGICLSADSWIKEVIKSKFSWTERLSEQPLKYLSFAKSDWSCIPHLRSQSPELIYCPRL